MTSISGSSSSSLKRTKSSLMGLNLLESKKQRPENTRPHQFSNTSTFFIQKKIKKYSWPNGITIKGEFSNKTFENATLTLSSGKKYTNVILTLMSDDFEKVELILTNKSIFTGSATKETGIINFKNGDMYWGTVRGGFMAANGSYRFDNGSWTTVDYITQKPIPVSFPKNTTSHTPNNTP